MDFPEIFEKAGTPEMKPIFYPDLIRMIEKGNVQLPAGGGESGASHQTGWHLVSPQMMPMPGTPDFCEFLMDGAM
jgi:hypothetical protein